MTPCDWPLRFISCEGGGCVHLDSLDPEAVESIQTVATQWLWEATRRRFGNCPVNIRPCLTGCHAGAAWTPWRVDGQWINVGCGRCGPIACACSRISQVSLPTVGEVTSVELDGTEMADGTWRLDNHRYLVRLDGGSWPRCQDLAADPPTWMVTYTPGLPVPEMGQTAAGQFACQLARRACGQKCDLPSNAVSVTRQGVSIQMDPTEGMKTGLWLVDNWIEMVNRPLVRIWSPDLSVVRSVPVTGSP